MYYHLQLTHLFVWDTTGFDDGIQTPSPIVHPVLFNSRAICTLSEGLKPRPSWLGSPALAHSVNSDNDITTFYGADRDVFVRLCFKIKQS
jgi:hypothetical protein